MAVTLSHETSSDPELLLARPTPIVLGSGITALAVVRSLGRARLRPVLGCRPGDFAGRSRWVHGRTFGLPRAADPGSLLELLERVGRKSGVLIPCDDVWCRAVAALPRAARSRYPASMPGREVMDVFLDKWLLAEELERFGVPHPITYNLVDENRLEGVDDASFFLKPRQSQLFDELYRHKAIRLGGHREAIDNLRTITRAGFGAVLQEYIPGPPTAHYFIDGFIDREGVVRALFARQRVRMFPPDFGNSSVTVSVPLDEVRDAADDLVRLLTGLGYRGAFSEELKRDPRDGRAKLLEVNCRPWWFIGFAAHCGIDMSLMIYRDALGLPVDSAHGYALGERCVVLSRDVQAYLLLRRSGELSLRTWLRSWVGAEPSILGTDDPLPALAYLGAVARERTGDRLLALRDGSRRRRRGT